MTVKHTEETEAPVETTSSKPLQVGTSWRSRWPVKQKIAKNPFVVPTYLEGVFPDGQNVTVPKVYDKIARLSSKEIAMDSQLGGAPAWQWIQGAFAEGIGFEGYPLLAQYSQRSEFYTPCETFANEMTRAWIVLSANGDDPKNDKINKITDCMVKMRLREVFHKAMLNDGIFGIGWVYPELKVGNTPIYENLDELQTKLVLDKGKVEKGSLLGFRSLDPTWMAPTAYNANMQLAPNFYQPESWFVMGTRVHESRLFKIESRPLRDILKPAYNFGGMPLIQMLKPYVQNYLETRQNVNNLVGAFTTWVLKTDMQAIMSDGGAEFEERLALFGAIHENLGIMAIDFTQEEFENISASLSSLDKLQAQAQEHMAACAQIPLVKLLSITPAGLNASSQDEIRVFYDAIHAKQENTFGFPLKKCLDLIQLHLYGEIDDDIVFTFKPLWEQSEVEIASIQKIRADTGSVFIAAGVIDPAEERERIAKDSASDYHGLEGPPPEPIMLDDGTTALGGESDAANKLGNTAIGKSDPLNGV